MDDLFRACVGSSETRDVIMDAAERKSDREREGDIAFRSLSQLSALN